MSHTLTSQTVPAQAMVYQIRIEGHLRPQWTDWFEGMSITLEEDGNTLLTGPVADQSALHGLLRKVRDLGMPLLSFNLIQQRNLYMKTNRNTGKTDRSVDVSQRTAALVAGFGLLVMFFAAIFANFFVIEGLIVPGDAEITTNNILANLPLFRFGIVSFLIVLICDVLVAWALYIFLKPAHKSLSVLAAWFRLLYTALFGAALFGLVIVLRLVSSADLLAAFEPGQLHAQVALFLNAFDYGWLFALVFFGVHLLVLGYLVFKSGYAPKIIGILLMIAGLGYLADSFAQFTLSNYADYESMFLLIVALPGTISELSLCFWLLFKGGKNQQPALTETN